MRTAMQTVVLRTTRSCCTFFLILVSGGLPRALGGQAPDAAPTLAAFVERRDCSRMEWLSVEGLSESAALRVPIELEGEVYWFQLDTGADAAIMYGDEPVRRGWIDLDDTASRHVRVPDVRLGGAHLPSARIALSRSRPVGRTAGTVGLNLLVGHLMVLDYPGRRFCLIPDADLPPDLLRRASGRAGGEIRDGKFFVTIEVAGRALDDVFFDTGASMFPLSVPYESWKELTGRSGAESDNERVMATSWGREVPLVGAPATGPVLIGNVQFDRPMIYHPDYETNFFAGASFPVGGLMGNVLLWDDVVLIDLTERPALYIVR